jgi:SSS family solute:Na+ symporter
MKAKIIQNLSEQHVANPGSYTHLWSTLGNFSDNPMGINWVGIVFGLGAVIAMGYWTTDFLVVQRVLSAKDLRSAKLAPIIGAGFKMMVPFIVILPGLLGLALLRDPAGHLMRLVPADLAWSPAGQAQGLHGYDEVLPLMLARYCGPGLLGLGITALVAGFMSGMAGNVSAFTTVLIYDIYGAFINKDASDEKKVTLGRWWTILGVVISIGTAYLVMHAQSIMDYVQSLFSFFIAPLFGTVILGMLWKRATPAGGWSGLLAGTLSSVGMYGWVKADPTAVRYVALSLQAQDQAQNMFRALWSCLICVIVTVVVSMITKPKPDSELKDLVYGLTPIPRDENVSMFHSPVFWGAVVAVVFVILQIIFW